MWGLAGSGISGESATDSPGGNYQNNTNSQFQHTGIDLTGRRGCRLDFFLRLNGVNAGDAVGVGVAATSLFAQEFSGNTARRSSSASSSPYRARTTRAT